MGASLDKIWVFDEGKLQDAMEQYLAASISAYPQQEERIRIAVAAIRDFLHSEYADKLRMSVGHSETD